MVKRILIILILCFAIPIRGQTPLFVLLPDGDYGSNSNVVGNWRVIEPLAPAFAGPDYWQLEDGQNVEVQYIFSAPIDLPNRPLIVDAVVIVGWTSIPGVYLITVAYRHLNWHCKDAFFIRKSDWELANDA